MWRCRTPPPQPGTYVGSIADAQPCDEVCAEQSLTCDGRHDWPQLVFSETGGGQGAYVRPEGTGATGTSVSAPAGDYAPVVACQNRSDACRFNTFVTVDE